MKRVDIDELLDVIENATSIVTTVLANPGAHTIDQLLLATIAWRLNDVDAELRALRLDFIEANAEGDT